MNNTTPTFEFGKNWRNYLEHIDSAKIDSAKRSLSNMLNQSDFKGKSFLDAGCGSGLFSLSALQLEAERVTSFDIDKDSTQCARLLNQKYGPYANWAIKEGNALNKDWISELGQYDIVYSWGVLHHTGNMWKALDNICIPVKQNGLLFISIYNDQGALSDFWVKVKKFYNRSNHITKLLIASIYHLTVLINRTYSGITKLAPLRQWYLGSPRGMNLWHDTVDWVGGYPFETATQTQILDFFTERGFTCQKTRITKGSGCSEYVFIRKNTQP